jgi:hypothetical protein
MTDTESAKQPDPRWSLRVLARFRMRRGWFGLFAGTLAGVLQAQDDDPVHWRVLLDNGGWRKARLLEARRGMFWAWMSLELEDAVVFVSGKRENIVEATVWRTAVKSPLYWRRLNILLGAADGKSAEEPALAVEPLMRQPPPPPQLMGEPLPQSLVQNDLLARPRRPRRSRPAAPVSPEFILPGEERHDV